MCGGQVLREEAAVGSRSPTLAINEPALGGSVPLLHRIADQSGPTKSIQDIVLSIQRHRPETSPSLPSHTAFV